MSAVLAGVLVAAAFGLFTRIGGRVAAAAALGTGALTWIVAAYGLEDFAYPFLASLAAALGGYLLGSLCDGLAAVRRRSVD